MNAVQPSALPEDVAPVGVNLYSAARFFRALPLQQRVALVVAAGAVAAEVHSFRLFENYAESPEGITEAEWGHVREILAPPQRLSVHGPFANRLAARKPASRQRGVKEYRFAIEVARRIGAACVVVHFSPWRRSPGNARTALQTLRELGDSAWCSGVKLAVENGGQCPGVEAFLSLIDELDHPNIGATLDTGHLTHLLTPVQQLAPDASPRYNELLLRLAAELASRNKLFHVHLNDVHPGDFGDHYAPGAGIVDFTALFSLLRGVGYDGLLAIEMHRATRRETGSLSPAEFSAAVRHVLKRWRAATA